MSNPSKPYILHMFTPAANMSPFDVNMAIDAGWERTPHYVLIQPDDVVALVQDMIFSRSANGLKHTAAFIGGRDVFLALEMMALARSAMFPPFEIPLFTDPSGAGTTAAGMVACTQHHLQAQHGIDMQGLRVLTMGGTGPVGIIASMLARKAGAEVTIISRSVERAEAVAHRCKEAMDVELNAGDDKTKNKMIEDVDIVYATAAAGVVAFNKDDIARAKNLKLAVDINSVPPSGIEDVNAQDNGAPMAHSSSGALGIGALAVGDVKYNTQNKMFKQMRDTDKPIFLGFEDALTVAQAHLASKNK